MSLDRQGFTAKLRHAKIIGSDRACFVRKEKRLDICWQLVKQEAPCARHHLPSTNYLGCSRREFKYSAGSAVQTRILPIVQAREGCSLQRSTQLDAAQRKKVHADDSSGGWLPRVGPGVLGGWAAQESDRYTRLARQRTSAMQVTVAQSIRDKGNSVPLREAEALQRVEEFTQQKSFPEDEVSRALKVLSSLRWMT